MIVDYIDNLSLYSAIPALRAGIAYLMNCPKEVTPRKSIAPGVTAAVSEYVTVRGDQRKWEAHNHLIDIHYVIQGEECIEWANRRDLTSIGKEPLQDVLRFTGDGTRITLHSGMFCILFPDDAHKTKISAGTQSTVVKAIVKIDI